MCDPIAQLNADMKTFSPGVFLLCGWFCASAATIELGTVADTTLFIGTINPGSSSGPELVAGVTPQNGVGHVLLQFNLAPVPTGAVIDSASVSLTITKKSQVAAAPHSFGLHRVARRWDEGQATWTAAATGVPWTTAGGDYEGDASASATLDLGPGTLSSAELVGDVQAWISGSVSNNGWLLRASDEGLNQSGRRIASHEAGDPISRPKLTVTYHLPEVATSIVNARSAGGIFRFDFQASAGKNYAVEFLDQIGDAWRSLTNVSATSDLLVNISDAITNSLRFYRVTNAPPTTP